jgi:hypothetical protein
MNSKSDPRREKELFEQAIELASVEERQRFLQEACEGDAGVEGGLRDLVNTAPPCAKRLDCAGSPALSFFVHSEDT